MDRFTEETAAGLMRNYNRNLYARNGVSSEVKEPEPFENESEADIPEEFITCQEHCDIVMSAQTVGEMMDALEAHTLECPTCGSDHVRVFEYDFGVCSQTGYSDAGERFECVACGESGEADDLFDRGASEHDSRAQNAFGVRTSVA